MNALVLDKARSEGGLTTFELWLRYFALGGMSSPFEVEAYLLGALMPSAHEYDVLALALNERFKEIGGHHLVPYSDS